MLTFKRMIYICTIIIVLLSVAIVMLSIGFRKSKMSHRQNIGELNYAMTKLSADNESKISQLHLSDEINRKLFSTREQIDKDIMAIQTELMEILAKNSLLG